MNWALFIIQWLHVLLGIFWFGSVLYLNIVVIPTILKLPLDQQRKLTIPLGTLSERVITPVSVLVLVLGLVRGTVFGPIQSLTFLFGTAYGITFLLALLATAALIAWGILVTARATRRLNQIPLDEAMLAEGKVPVAFTTQMQRVKVFVLLELLGFFVIFSCMILMGFGL